MTSAHRTLRQPTRRSVAITHPW